MEAAVHVLAEGTPGSQYPTVESSSEVLRARMGPLEIQL